MDFFEKTLSQNYVFRGRIMNVRDDTVQLPDGSTAPREVIEHTGGACVLPLTDDNQVLMVRQYRYPHERLFLEIPAGKLEKGEDPFLCAKRELLEETGATADTFLPLGELYPTPGYCGEIIWMYAATGLTFGEQDTDEDEFLSVERVPLEKAVEMILNGEIKDAKTQTAILKLKLLKDSGKI